MECSADDEGRTRRSIDGPYRIIERFQRAKIKLQNLLFSYRQKIMDKIKVITGKIVKNRAETIQWKDNLELYIGMSEREQPMLHQSSDYAREISSAIIDAMWDQMADSEFSHIGEKNQLAKILRAEMYERDQGSAVNLD